MSVISLCKTPASQFSSENVQVCIQEHGQSVMIEGLGLFSKMTQFLYNRNWDLRAFSVTCLHTNSWV